MNKLRFGVVGLRVGGGHAAHLSTCPKAELLGICDVDQDKLDNNSQFDSKAVPIRTTDFMDLVNNPDIDAIDVATPDHFHREHAIAALEAGKHVFCEKPLALTMEDCLAIIEAESKAKGKFFIGQVCRYAPGFAKAKEIFDAGLIGDLFFVESEYAHDYSHFTLDHWRCDPKIMRYPIVGGGCHAVDLLRWFTGNPIEVMAYGNQKCLTDWPPIMDTNIAIFKCQNDVMGKVFCATGCKRPYTMRTLIYGTKGTIVCDNTSSDIQVYVESLKPENEALKGAGFTNIPVEISSHNFAMELDDFIDAVVNDKEVLLNATEGANTVAACVAVVESTDEGRPVRIKNLPQ